MKEQKQQFKFTKYFFIIYSNRGICVSDKFNCCFFLAVHTIHNRIFVYRGKYFIVHISYSKLATSTSYVCIYLAVRKHLLLSARKQNYARFR